MCDCFEIYFYLFHFVLYIFCNFGICKVCLRFILIYFIFYTCRIQHSSLLENLNKGNTRFYIKLYYLYTKAIVFIVFNMSSGIWYFNNPRSQLSLDWYFFQALDQIVIGLDLLYYEIWFTIHILHLFFNLPKFII